VFLRREDAQVLAEVDQCRTLLGELELDAPDDEATLVRTLVADDIDRRLLQGRGLLKREQLRLPASWASK
jgi:hypothetical protein